MIGLSTEWNAILRDEAVRTSSIDSLNGPVQFVDELSCFGQSVVLGKSGSQSGFHHWKTKMRGVRDSLNFVESQKALADCGERDLRRHQGQSSDFL